MEQTQNASLVAALPRINSSVKNAVHRAGTIAKRGFGLLNQNKYKLLFIWTVYHSILKDNIHVQIGRTKLVTVETLRGMSSCSALPYSTHPFCVWEMVEQFPVEDLKLSSTASERLIRAEGSLTMCALLE